MKRDSLARLSEICLQIASITDRKGESGDTTYCDELGLGYLALSGCRAVGDAFYCEDCVKTWAERNGKEFDKQYKDPEGMFVKWWNRTVDMQCSGMNIKKYRVISGMYMED